MPKVFAILSCQKRQVVEVPSGCSVSKGIDFLLNECLYRIGADAIVKVTNDGSHDVYMELPFFIEG